MKLFNKYKFSDKRQSLGGIISTIMGLLALASLIYGVYISFKAQGYAGLKVGSLGLLSLFISVIGTIIGLLSFKEDDKFYTLIRFCRACIVKGWFDALWNTCSIYDSGISYGIIIKYADMDYIGLWDYKCFIKEMWLCLMIMY